MLTGTLVIEHHDEEGQDGPVSIDLTFKGQACAHEVAVLNYIKACITLIKNIPVTELPGLERAAADLFVQSIKTGQLFNRGGDI